MIHAGRAVKLANIKEPKESQPAIGLAYKSGARRSELRMRKIELGMQPSWSVSRSTAALQGAGAKLHQGDAGSYALAHGG